MARHELGEAFGRVSGVTPRPPEPARPRPDPTHNKWLPTAHRRPITTTPKLPEDRGRARWLPADDDARATTPPTLLEEHGGHNRAIVHDPLPALNDQSSLDRWITAGVAPVSDAAGSRPVVVGTPDPVDDDTDCRAQRSLAGLIRAGDSDAAAGFYEAHARKIHDYCAKACRWELIEQACEASWVEFVGRIRTSAEPHADLEDVLLKATRGAAAGRFDVASPTMVGAAIQATRTGATCAAMPELLAAEANGELFRGNETVRAHVARCSVCGVTATRMKQAEQAFRQAIGWIHPSRPDQA